MIAEGMQGEEGLIHNLLITNASGCVLLAKYYDGSTTEEREQFEKRLFDLTHDGWALAKNETHQVASIDDGSTDFYTVYTSVGELLLFITGSGVYDELTLSEILARMTDVLKQVGKLCTDGVTENNFLKEYTTVLLCLDEMICKGVLHNMETEVIRNNVQMHLLERRRVKK